VAMRFRHLRRSAKEAVGVYYSNIHGRGLFCKREIDQGEMIIEYAGEVIRAALCDQREKYYESKVTNHTHFLPSKYKPANAHILNKGDSRG
jgi:histone-lysine N-methyltransferase MLL1